MPRSAAKPPNGSANLGFEAKLWAAANSLRGPVDPGDFKSCIFLTRAFGAGGDIYEVGMGGRRGEG